MPQKRNNQKARIPKLVGIISLAPLPGSPKAHTLGAVKALERAGLLAIQEAKLFQTHGFDAVLIENRGDAPFYNGKAPTETVASLSMILAALKETTKLKLGLSILDQDDMAALGIAAVTGIDFIQIHSKTCSLAQIAREKLRLSAENLMVFSDWNENFSLGEEDEFIENSLSDAYILNRGRLAEFPNHIKQMNLPFFLSTELDAGDDLSELGRFHSPRFIVGRSVRKSGKLDPKLLKAFSATLKKLAQQKNGKTRRSSH